MSTRQPCPSDLTDDEWAFYDVFTVLRVPFTHITLCQRRAPYVGGQSGVS